MKIVTKDKQINGQTDAAQHKKKNEKIKKGEQRKGEGVKRKREEGRKERTMGWMEDG